ncbi:circumsporozoite protein-like [Ischnura elegans]|uniref:circumsporozoite protein-like n=1 Tax=Ischnura elegans TaxID=197161 RepID=UPI001ED8A9DE|nr:circumsporozoite protein-like [Ischnura elegans]
MVKVLLICTLAVFLMASPGTGKELSDELYETPRGENLRQRRTLEHLGDILKIAKIVFPGVFGETSNPHYPQWPQMPQGYNFPQIPGFPQLPGFPQIPGYPQLPGYPQMTGYPPIPNSPQGSYFPPRPYPPAGTYNPQGQNNPMGTFNPPPQYRFQQVPQPYRVPG